MAVTLTSAAYEINAV